MTLRSAVGRRRSWSKVTDAAPTHDELLPLVEAAASVADHGSLRPWRLIELRGAARQRLGVALAASAGLEGDAAEKLAAKPLRAPLLIAVVACRKPSHKVPHWEQDATAAGVAHLLSLLLDDAGWGVMWRTGVHTRSKQVRKAHHLAADEELLGWLYVGGKSEQGGAPRRSIDPEEFISAL